MNRTQPWRMSWRADPRARRLADRHYNRQKPGAPRFVPPGRCLVLLTDEADALWTTSWPYAEYVQHAWPGAMVNTLFRREPACPDRASDLITAALAATRAHWPDLPPLGIITFVDPTKVKRKRDAGRCYLCAGWRITFWRVLRSRPDDLARMCALTPHCRVEYDLAVDLDATDELELARQVFIKLTQGRSGRLRRTGWRHYVNPSGSSASMPGYLSGYVNRMAAAVERLQQVSLECRPALDIIAKYGAEPNVLLYVDPPYLGSTRGNDHAYRHEMRTNAAHCDLAEALRTARAAVVLSGYPSDLYDRALYPDWNRHTIPASTGQGGTWANRTEVLWSNRPLSTQLDLFA